MSNPRKNSYGYTLRALCGLDMADFQDITLHVSASASGIGFTLNLSASTLFIGQSTVYSSTEGLTFTSGQWVYGQTLTAQSFSTADTWNMRVEASATGKYFISDTASFTVDE